jgi:hypothetical protein
MRSTKDFTRRVFAYIKKVNRDRELPSAAVRVALVIADHWNEESGEARLSLETIALEAGLGEGTVRRMLPVLVERGHVAVQWGSRGSRHSHRYTPLEKCANGGAIESANEGASVEKPKAPNQGIKAPFQLKKAPTGALNTVEHTEHSKSAAPPRSSARVERESATNGDDAPPVQRAPGGALTETVERQHPSPSASPLPMRRPARPAPPMGAAANDAVRAETATLRSKILAAHPDLPIGDAEDVQRTLCGMVISGDHPADVVRALGDVLSRGAGGRTLATALKAVEADLAQEIPF